MGWGQLAGYSPRPQCPACSRARPDLLEQTPFDLAKDPRGLSLLLSGSLAHWKAVWATLVVSGFTRSEGSGEGLQAQAQSPTATPSLGHSSVSSA